MNATPSLRRAALAYLLLLLYAWLVFTVLCFAGCTDLRVGSTPASRVAKTAVAGKGTPGQCAVFAVELQKVFQAERIPSRVFCFDLDGEPIGHAGLIYDDRGRTMFVDNMNDDAVWLKSGASDDYLARQLVGPLSPVPRVR